MGCSLCSERGSRGHSDFPTPTGYSKVTEIVADIESEAVQFNLQDIAAVIERFEEKVKAKNLTVRTAMEGLDAKVVRLEGKVTSLVENVQVETPLIQHADMTERGPGGLDAEPIDKISFIKAYALRVKSQTANLRGFLDERIQEIEVKHNLKINSLTQRISILEKELTEKDGILKARDAHDQANTRKSSYNDDRGSVSSVHVFESRGSFDFAYGLDDSEDPSRSKLSL